MDTYKSLQLVIQDSQQVMQEIYSAFQLCSDLIQKIEYATTKYLNRDDFAESPPLHTDQPPPVGLIIDANGDISP